jgi:Zn-dependent protease with chaperone function
VNFFEAQDKARRNTFHLVLLFILAVAGLILLTNLFLLCIYAFVRTDEIVVSPQTLYDYFTWKEFATVSVGVLLFVLGGSLYKLHSLSGGGAQIARSLGGQLIALSTRDLQQRRLLNVVEEMAIAAGMPIPQVYLLDDDSINAFAAGSTPGSAVIGITRGALQRLNRDELQGVIAHEFSHIANGDMRRNIR